MGVEKPPAICHVTVDVLAAIEKGAILDRANVGVLATAHVLSIGAVPEVALVEEMEGEDIIFFVFGKHFFLLRVVYHVESQTSTYIIRQRDCHCVIVIV